VLRKAQKVLGNYAGFRERFEKRASEVNYGNLLGEVLYPYTGAKR